MGLFLVLACAPRLYSEPTEEWRAPDNSWGAVESLPDGFEALEQGFEVGQVMPELQGVDQFGETVSLWQFYGRPVLVDISIFACAPCRELACDVDRTQADYAAYDLVYLSVLPQNMDTQPPSAEDLAGWSSFYEITQPVMADSVDWNLDAVPLQTFPKVYLLDSELRIVSNSVGTTDGEIREALNGHLGLSEDPVSDLENPPQGCPEP